MSIESMTIALHHSKATGAVKLVLLGIANHDGDGGAWPSVATLAKYANTTPRSVQRAIARLIDTGEIRRGVQKGGLASTPEHKRPNLYEFILECPEGCDRTKNHRVVDKPVDNPDLGVTPVSPGDATVTRGVTPVSPGGVTPVSPEPYLEPSIEHVPSFALVSPADGSICFACGKPHPGTEKYCRPCVNSGLNNPMISCGNCGVAGRRQVPGQSVFYCGCSPRT